jgi:hypothetical protein
VVGAVAAVLPAAADSPVAAVAAAVVVREDHGNYAP